MMTFIPPCCGDEVKSNAERKVLCRDGLWYFIDRYGVEHEKTEGPFAQAAGNMFSLKKVLAEHFGKTIDMRDTLAACGVMFPDVEFRSGGQEVIPEIIFDKRTENITAYLNQVFDYWEGRQHRRPRPLSPQNRKAIAAFLRADFTYIPSRGDRLNEVDQRLLRLTREQAMLLDALSLNDHLIIEGGAGTGKTMLAMEYARRECGRGRRVLYLTYNKNLARNIISCLGEQCGENIKIVNLHALFGEYVRVDAEAMAQDPNLYFTQELPEDVLSYLEELSQEELGALQFDDLILDEGQDILKPEYLLVMDLLLKGGLEKGCWAVFYDEKQNLYNPEFADGFQLLTSYSNTRFKLFINCRNTAQIGTFNAQMSHTQLEEYLKENGEEVHVVSYADEADLQKKTVELLKKLRAEGVALGDVAFLSPKRLKNSRLSRLALGRFRFNELKDGFQRKEDEPVYSTIQGFKGLDSKVVVLIELDQVPASLYSQFVYTGCSRARSLLIVFQREAGDKF